jgi:long-chain acyl-CoA synthetase
MLGVPAFYRMILDNDRVDSYDMSSLRYCWCGGDVLPGELFNRWRTRVGVPIYQNFGATETVFVGMSPLDEEPSPNVIGRVVASKRIRIFDPHTLGEVPVNTAGEIAVTTDHLMEGYWNNTSETESSFVILDGVRYYRMKDVVLKNDKSDLVYVDRGADIIKYKGYRISCSEIEAVLQDHDAVTEACVVGTPDDKFGERIKAIVVLREGVRGVGAGDLIHWCRERLSPVKIPHHIEFRDMLPKSKVGKLLRRDVREEERRKAGKPEGALGDAPVATGASNG